jgi:hypothetical protein
VLNQHRLVVDPKVIRQDFESVSEYPNDTRQSFLLFHQLSRITKDRGALRHDDRLDALSIGVNYWTTAMAQDDKKKVQERKEDKLKAELERFMQTALGRPQKSKGWIQPHRN